jgi:hypothetical protein
VDAAEFSYSRLRALLTLVSIPLVALLALAMLGMGVFSAIEGPAVLSQRVSVLALSTFGLWLLTAMIFRIRYVYVLSTRYTISDAGIVELAPMGSRKLSWSDIALSEHFPLIFFLRLNVQSGGRPIALFLDRRLFLSRISDARNARVLGLVKGHVVGHFRNRWIL